MTDFLELPEEDFVPMSEEDPVHYEYVIIDDERKMVGDDDTHPNLETENYCMTVYLRSSKAALNFFKGLRPQDTVQFLSLDHDLGDLDTIMPFVDWLEESVYNGTAPQIEEILVHTANPVGAKQITSSNLLNQAYKVRRIGLELFEKEVR